MNILLPLNYFTHQYGNCSESFIKEGKLVWTSETFWWEGYYKQIKNELQKYFPDAKITRMYRGRPDEKDFGTSKRIRIKFSNEEDETSFLLLNSTLEIKLEDFHAK